MNTITATCPQPTVPWTAAAPADKPAAPEGEAAEDKYVPRHEDRSWLMPKPKQDKHGELHIDAMKRSDMARPASQISRQDMIRVFGADGATLHDLAKSKPDITIGGLMQLKRVDSSQITDVADLLSKRSDLGLNDLMDKSGPGAALLKPATWDEPSKSLLGQRQGVRPDDLSSLGDQLRFSYGTEKDRAWGRATDLLATRGDLDTKTMESEAQGVKGTETASEAYQRFEDKFGDHNYSRPAFDLVA